MKALIVNILWGILGLGNALAQPRPLHPNVTVDTYATLSRQGVRLAQDPVSWTLFYADTDGSVFQLRPNANGQLTEVLIAGVGQHGIEFLQGMAFADSVLILVGIRRLPYEGVGRVAKGRLRPDGSRQWTTLFETAPYPYSNTAYDHAFNGVCLSRSRDSIYVTSGSRTDHGEVQDNGGRFPSLRETALTARIFKLPLAAENLHLPNDEAVIRQSGLLFCEGTRNTFDLALNSEGRLFGAENAGNRSDPEELNWLRAGRHYGYPWVIGGNDTPQQYPNYDPNNDPLLSPGYRSDGFRNDPAYPARPNVPFTAAIVNTGPDAWFVVDPATRQGVPSNTITSFTSHASPLGLVFDVDSVLADFTGLGFVLGYTPGRGLDLSSLRLQYDPAVDNYRMQVNRIAEGFDTPVDAELVGTTLYVLDRGRKTVSRVRFRERTYPEADLSLSMTASRRTPAVGEEVAIGMTVENRGPSAARSVEVHNRLPAGFVFSQSADFQPVASGIRATIAELPPGEKRQLTYRGRVTQSGYYRNSAQILRARNRDPDSRANTGTADGEDDAASVDFRTQPADGSQRASDNPLAQTLPAVQSNQPPPDPNRPDLSVQMSLTNRSPRRNEVFTVTLSVRNGGGVPADGVRLKCLLPAGMAFASGEGWAISGSELTSPLFSIGPGQRQSQMLQLRPTSAGPFTLKSTLTGPADADSTPGNGYDNGEDDEARTDGRGLP